MIVVLSAKVTDEFSTAVCSDEPTAHWPYFGAQMSLQLRGLSNSTHFELFKVFLAGKVNDPIVVLKPMGN